MRAPAEAYLGMSSTELSAVVHAEPAPVEPSDVQAELVASEPAGAEMPLKDMVETLRRELLLEIWDVQEVVQKAVEVLEVDASGSLYTKAHRCYSALGTRSIAGAGAAPADAEATDGTRPNTTDSEDPTKMCIICTDKPRAVRLLPCGVLLQFSSTESFGCLPKCPE